MDRVRIGTLGTARITANALIAPALEVPEAVLAAVAARDPARARDFAAARGIRQVHDSYEELIADPDIDAVYNPLPNSLHAQWTLKAIEAGKHVLGEKPFTANLAEAENVATAVQESGLVVMEAYHYRYHPLARRMREIVQGVGGGGDNDGDLGAVRHIEVTLCFPIDDASDIRFRYELGGGATMDGGCYAINCLRFLGPGEPEVASASARESSPGVDAVMTAAFHFPASAATGGFRASLLPEGPFTADVRVQGEDGELSVANFMAPQHGHRLEVAVRGKTRREQVAGPATYTGQLRA